jgi:hypothetical protein
MTIRLLAVAASLWLISSCSAQDSPQPAAAKPSAASESKPEENDKLLERARERNGGKEPSVLDVWNKILRSAEERAGAIKNVGKPRVVPKGAKPEIIITYDGLITFDGKPLRLGEHIDKWRAVLPKDVVCRSNVAIRCYWDKLGLKIITDEKEAKVVMQIDIHINSERVEPWMLPDTPSYKTKPNETFKGYLEIDGYGIDNDTRFSELRSGVDARRALDCGSLDCSHPRGGGGGSQTYIAIRFDGRSEHNKLRSVTMAGGPSGN